MIDEKDNDIELLAGQVWNAPERPDWAAKILVETAKFLKPQAQVVTRPIPPELSELHPAAPDYRDLLGKKGGAE